MGGQIPKAVVASALAVCISAPQSALAASSLTITGYFKLSYERVMLSNFTGTGRNREDRVADDRSRIYFRVVEDLGDGLQAIGQVDWRITMDAGAAAANGQNYVGLRSKTWGTVQLGRLELHYKYSASKINSKASYKSTNLSLLAFAGGGGTAIANNSRTPNVINYDSPNWNGFRFQAAYSTNAAGAEADIASATRKGSAWNLRPYYKTKNLEVGYSYWKSKPDAPGAATIDQRGDRLWGSYKWKDFYVGLAYDKAKFKNSTTGAVTSDRAAWSIPLMYKTGRHAFHVEYSQARDDKATGGVNDGAKMWALAYAYDLSKRSSVALTYAKIKNDRGAVYNLYGSAGAQGSPDAAVAAGEDPSVIALTVKHSF
jgi:predicted porin